MFDTVLNTPLWCIWQRQLTRALLLDQTNGQFALRENWVKLAEIASFIFLRKIFLERKLYFKNAK